MLGFVGVAVFGFTAFNHGGGHGHEGCLAAVANRLDCPVGSDARGFVSFHLDTFKSFSAGVLGTGSSAASLLTALFLAAIGLGIALGNFLSPPEAGLSFRRCYSAAAFLLPFKRGLVRWLALHERSPAAS
ncbi:MAG: hypothetical protein A3B37_02060 [Candidatus Sungbacteria bacterium RIFCSPLOWO2_01_FULL_59_16]|uniref:Uncharacterized protein n=1 Tax=Candidatus Sungbacteria bacterium RIFCSPLOWO2_01_FULL_59_16 TaxID=1802280 RepID=A0A1G2LCU8_9BACT|nr:MAG: hypothetical protein A3B37_02060 [Candidatus Sungbacteria bacterium RIFCSPLOWO2_01_FULL_59_16]